MPERTFPELIGDLDIVSTNLKGRLHEVPHLAGMQATLESWVIEARSLESQQEVFTARLREINEQRRAVEARGVALNSQTRDALSGHYGPKSQTMREFGYLPRGRKPAASKETPKQAPPQTARAAAS
jgi:hypothetical protein